MPASFKKIFRIENTHKKKNKVTNNSRCLGRENLKLRIKLAMLKYFAMKKITPNIGFLAMNRNGRSVNVTKVFILNDRDTISYFL